MKRHVASVDQHLLLLLCVVCHVLVELRPNAKDSQAQRSPSFKLRTPTVRRVHALRSLGCRDAKVQVRCCVLIATDIVHSGCLEAELQVV